MCEILWITAAGGTVVCQEEVFLESDESLSAEALSTFSGTPTGQAAFCVHGAQKPLRLILKKR